MQAVTNFVATTQKTLMIADWVPVANIGSAFGRSILAAGQLFGISTGGRLCGVANLGRGLLPLAGGAWITLRSAQNKTFKRDVGLYLAGTVALFGYDIARGAANFSYANKLTNLAKGLEETLKPLDYIPLQGCASGAGRILLGGTQTFGGIGYSIGSAIAWLPNKILGAMGETQGAWHGIKFGVLQAKEGLLNLGRGVVAMVPWVGGKALTYYETTRFPAMVR